MHPACHVEYEKGSVHCRLCFHNCIIDNGQRGLCRVRENRNNTLYSLNYGRLVAEHADPIEKKPFFHVLPGTTSYSIATAGCNLRCHNCQNHHISQIVSDASLQVAEKSPAEIVNKALESGCSSISYTYVEPTIFYEFAFDCCTAAKEHGLYNFFVSNGYMQERPARELAGVVDGINIDIKSFSPSFYKNFVGGKLQHVLDNVVRMRELGVWVELTTLLIPGYTDDSKELRDLARFIVSVDSTMPWHINAFHPHYKMHSVPSTSHAQLQMAADIGREEGVCFIYLGNIAADRSTFCPACGVELINRDSYAGQKMYMGLDRCSSCGYALPGIFS